MGMTFKVPKFEDGHILSEQELYALARLSMEFFRWNCIAGKKFGFFAPSETDLILSSNSWNQFDWKNDNLFVTNVFVISLQGYPFIIPGQKKIEKVGKTLFAVAYLAKNSQSYNDDGYNIDFKWDLPEIQSDQETEPFLIELGQVTGNDTNRKFSITPPALQFNGTSKLWKTGSILKENIDKYIEQLIIAAGENNLDCSEYIDRLERLNLFSKNTEVAEFIDIALLTLKSAKGFYYRLIDDEGKRYQYDESYRNYRGRVLENKLAENYGSLTEPEIFEPISELLQMEVITGQHQQNFIEELTDLFDSDKHLFQKLQIKGQRISQSVQIKRQRISQSEGYPQEFDVQRWLYRYELQPNAKENHTLVIEFNKDPTNVAFIFTNEKDLTSTHLTPLKQIKQKSQPENANNKRYELPPFNTESYLFVAAPKEIINQVELIKK